MRVFERSVRPWALVTEDDQMLDMRIGHGCGEPGPVCLKHFEDLAIAESGEVEVVLRSLYDHLMPASAGFDTLEGTQFL
jgi:hypothetical protein